MKHLRMLFVWAAGPLAVAVLAVAGVRVTEARADNDQAAAELRTTRSQVDRLLALRAARETVAEHKKPEQDLITRASEVLRAAGLPESALAAVGTQSDTTASAQRSEGARYGRQVVRFSLSGLTVPELGRFLAEWAATQSLWMPIEIHLNRARRIDVPPEAHATYDVTLLVRALYLAPE